MRPLIGACNSVIFEIELGLPHRRLIGADGGLRVAVGLRALLESLVGDGLVAHQLLAAVEVGLGVDQVGFGLLEIGARLIERVLERPLVDGEQQIALLDDLSVLEVDRIEIAGFARAHLDRIDRGKTADIFVVIEQRALDRIGDGHRRRRRRAALLLLFAAAYDQSRKQQGGRGPQTNTSGGKGLAELVI